MGDADSRGPLDRRAFLVLTGGTLAASALPLGVVGCSKKDPLATVAEGTVVTVPVNAHVVRVASVKTAVEGNVLPELVADFEKAGPYRVELVPGEAVYTWAREGKADLVISHYGHREAEDFVLDGLGEWPRTIFSNQMALVGPPSDPAGVRGLDDAGEAFRRIAVTRSRFVLNDIDGVRYLTEILWSAAGKPPRSGWLLDEGHRKDGAVERASELGAYTLWGLTPFLRVAGRTALALEPLVLADPLLQRLLVSVVVKPSKVPGVNVDGAVGIGVSWAAAARVRQPQTGRTPVEARGGPWARRCRLSHRAWPPSFDPRLRGSVGGCVCIAPPAAPCASIPAATLGTRARDRAGTRARWVALADESPTRCSKACSVSSRRCSTTCSPRTRASWWHGLGRRLPVLRTRLLAARGARAVRAARPVAVRSAPHRDRGARTRDEARAGARHGRGRQARRHGASLRQSPPDGRQRLVGTHRRGRGAWDLAPS